MLRASLHTVGCRLNHAETAILGDQLRSRGYELVEFGQPSDLFILNTCSVTASAESDCRSVIRKVRGASPNAFVAVTGCYAQTAAEVLKRMDGIDLIVGAQHKMELPRFVTSLERRPSPEVLHTRTISRDNFTIEGVGEYPETRANLKVQDGCNFMCSFCIIPFSRGHERSRGFEDILREAEGLIARGHRELVVTGVNVGRYHDRGLSLSDILERLEALPGLDRIRISSIEPSTVSDRLLEQMAGPSKLCPYLHVPVQSGDDAVLTAMNRTYTAGDYIRLIEKAARLIPNLGLGTDVMVGFPAESEAAFANTRAMLRDLPFAYFHVFSYSPRPGTAAFKSAAKLDHRRIKARSKELCTLSRAKRLSFYHRYLDRVVSVLFESRNNQGLFTGLTDNYIRVGVASDGLITNQMLSARLHGTMDGLALGTLVDPVSSRDSLKA
jgi:threonylcarbamoyladenosine tRNA methylthiotransferase MtaB